MIGATAKRGRPRKPAVLQPSVFMLDFDVLQLRNHILGD
jgi:hypothetical protein